MTNGNGGQPTKRRRATAQMVADAAGVSRSAVSRAFTEGAYLDAEKRSRIMAVAEELGYQPNALAASLQGRRSHLVAIFSGNIRGAYDTDFITRLVSELNALDKWPILIDGAGERARTATLDVLRYPLDAMILRGGSMPADLTEQCAKLGIPMIISGRPVEAPGVDNVCCRHAIGTRAVTELLLEKGRRRFVHIAGPGDFFSSAERRLGVLSALEAAGLDFVAEAEGDFTVDGGYRAALGLLDNNAFDALVCANDSMAIGALAAAGERGRHVPGDLSVVGFDDLAIAKWPSFNLTTVRNPIDAAITEILSLLERRLEDPSKPGETRYVDPHVVLRGTH